MKKLIVCLSFALISGAVFAQEESIGNEFKYSLGVHAGGVTGNGFSFRYVPDNFGIQVTGIPIFNGRNDFYSSTAVSLMYTVRKHEKLDLFTYFGSHLEHRRYESWIDIWPEPIEPQTFRETNLHLGLGAGINIHLWEIIDLSLQAGYGLFNVNRSDFIRTGLTGEIGVYYRF
jgi:hypothetical protein